MAIAQKPVLIAAALSGRSISKHGFGRARHCRPTKRLPQVIDKKNCKPGDLVFNTMRRTFGQCRHCVGDGKVHPFSPQVAPEVRVEDMRQSLLAARRVAPPGYANGWRRSARWTTSNKQLQAARAAWFSRCLGRLQNGRSTFRCPMTFPPSFQTFQQSRGALPWRVELRPCPRRRSPCTDDAGHLAPGRG